jgi:hypothetical protein
MSYERESKELRIVLDAAAAIAYEAMVLRMKEGVPTIKVQPSHFVSFLVADFFSTHFEKDMAVLIAEFFDSDAFYELARKELMAAALAEAQRIKGKRRRSRVGKGARPSKDSEALTP